MPNIFKFVLCICGGCLHMCVLCTCMFMFICVYSSICCICWGGGVLFVEISKALIPFSERNDIYHIFQNA